MKRQAEIIKQLSDKEITINIYLTQITILFLAIILGWFLLDGWSGLSSLFQWDPHKIIVYGGGSAILVIFIELVLERKLPQYLLDDGGINERVFRGKSISEILIMTIIIALAEELLFRGVIQTSFGVITASILFALLHIRYMHKIVLFALTVLLSFFLGWIFYLTGNLFITIIAHFIIDFTLGCILSYRNNESKL